MLLRKCNSSEILVHYTRYIYVYMYRKKKWKTFTTRNWCEEFQYVSHYSRLFPGKLFNWTQRPFFKQFSLILFWIAFFLYSFLFFFYCTRFCSCYIWNPQKTMLSNFLLLFYDSSNEFFVKYFVFFVNIKTKLKVET